MIILIKLYAPHVLQRFGDNMKSIFVQMPSYHDHELYNTVYDLINKSSGEYNINIGSHIVLYKDEELKIPELKNFKYNIEEAPKGIGIGYARFQSHKFYNGEDYYLQIDSHSIMNQDWDKQIIGYIKHYNDMGFEKPLITTYPRNYCYLDDGSIKFDESDHSTQISFLENTKQFEEIRIPTQTAWSNELDNVFSRSVSGGSIFTVGDFINPNPKIAFYGEEIFTAARAFTSGYDLLISPKQFMYHLYFDHSRPKESKRRLTWQDWPIEFELIDKMSKKEIYDTFTKNIIGPQNLGTERSLKQYGNLVGLDFENGRVFEACEE